MLLQVLVLIGTLIQILMLLRFLLLGLMHVLLLLWALLDLTGIHLLEEGVLSLRPERVHAIGVLAEITVGVSILKLVDSSICSLIFMDPITSRIQVLVLMLMLHFVGVLVSHSHWVLMLHRHLVRVVACHWSIHVIHLLVHLHLIVHLLVDLPALELALHPRLPHGGDQDAAAPSTFLVYIKIKSVNKDENDWQDVEDGDAKDNEKEKESRHVHPITWDQPLT